MYCKFENLTRAIHFSPSPYLSFPFLLSFSLSSLLRPHLLSLTLAAHSSTSAKAASSLLRPTQPQTASFLVELFITFILDFSTNHHYRRVPSATHASVWPSKTMSKFYIFEKHHQNSHFIRLLLWQKVEVTFSIVVLAMHGCY